MVEFAVGDSGASAHPLNIARSDYRAVTHAVLVFKSPIDDIRDDLHIAMGMGSEPLSGLDTILVDNPKRPEAHVSPIVIIGKGEGMSGC